MHPLQPGPRLPEGPRLAGSGTLKKDLKDAQKKVTLEAMGVRGHRDSMVVTRQEVGDPHHGLIPGDVVSRSWSSPACSHGTG